MSVLPPGNMHAPFIILSNSIYARRSDGSYYPGSVEGKSDDLYTVKYCDGATEQIREENLTWLGFWGLPPLCWPKTPVIQPVASSWESFESQALYLREGQGETSPASEEDVCVRAKRSEPEPDLTKSPFLTPKQTACRQTRSSVIRLNSNMLTKDGNLREVRANFTDTGQPQSPSPTKERFDKVRDSVFLEDRLHSTAGEMTRTQNTDETCDNQRQKELDMTYEDEPIYRYYLERRRMAAERGISRDHTGLEDTDYFTTDFCKPSFMLENNPHGFSPTHFFNSPLPFFDHQLGMTLFRASPHAVIPTSFRLQLKARRKDEKKKCRKVYGIENRHFWCTQCKWKKACTRFTNGSKMISNGFI